MSTLLQVMDVTKVYKNQPKPGLDHVSFKVAQGEFLGIMGASGSGKTTLLNVLSTIDVPTSGHIIMGKTHIEKLGQGQAADFRKNNLGFIFQEYFLLDSLTVRENIAVPLTLLHKPAKEIDRKVNELAELFGIDSQLKKYPSELSGGQRQRVAAARAMVGCNVLMGSPPGGTVFHAVPVLLGVLAFQVHSQPQAAAAAQAHQ